MPAAFPDRLPNWTWWLPLPIFHLATWISLATRLNDGVALCYLPLVLGLALRLFRYRRDELLGRSIQSISPLRQADGRLSSRAGKAFLRRAIAGDAPVFEWSHRDSAGRQLPCEVRLVRMPGGTC